MSSVKSSFNSPFIQRVVKTGKWWWDQKIWFHPEPSVLPEEPSNSITFLQPCLNVFNWRRFWASRLLACVSAHSRRTDPDRDSVQRPSLWAGSSFIACSDARSINFLITLRSAARSASSARNQTDRSDYNAITKGWNTPQANKEYCPHVRQNLEDCEEPLTWPGSDQSAVSVQFSAEGEEEPKNSGVMNELKCSLNVNIWTEF